MAMEATFMAMGVGRPRLPIRGGLPLLVDLTTDGVDLMSMGRLQRDGVDPKQILCFEK